MKISLIYFIRFVELLNEIFNDKFPFFLSFFLFNGCVYQFTNYEVKNHHESKKTKLFF